MEKVLPYDLSAVESFFRANFKKPARGIMARLLGERSEYDYSILHASAHECSRDFPGVDLLWVEVGEPFLEFTQLPGSRSRGLIAINQTGALYLHSAAPENIQRVLSSAGEIESLPPRSVAKLLCDGLLSRKGTRHRLVESYTAIEQMESSLKGYLVDKQEADKVREMIIAPRFEHASSSGTILRFTTLSGWMHDAKQLNLIKAVISQDKSVDCVQELLTDRIFSATPLLRC